MSEQVAGGRIDVSVLGPVQLRRDGVPVPLGPQLTTLLGILLLELGKPVPSRRLATLLAGDDVSDAARATLRSHVAHLRRALEPGERALEPGERGQRGKGLIATVGSGTAAGYRLDLEPACVDAVRFEESVRESRRLLALGDAEQTDRAVAILRTALDDWHGEPYADLADRPFALVEIARLRAVHRAALLAYAEAVNESGRHAEAIGDLIGAVAVDPHDEGLRCMLALTLYRDGRTDEAAEVCRHGLALLGGRGIDAPELHRLQRDILRREVRQPSGGPSGGSSVPRMLPPDLPRFVGRAQELSTAEDRLVGRDEPRSAVLLVLGPAGVGKTSASLRLAHRLAPRFPDGQLYANLRGFDASAAALAPTEVLRVFLEALGVAPEQIPANLNAQMARYQAQLRDRRILIVLDNAHDADQVRPLLPASTTCATVVTSRNRMSSLIAVDGAHPLTLGLLDEEEAGQLVADRIGADRAGKEPEAVAEIARLCAGLPLALSIAAARAAANPQFTLQALADDLAGAGVLDRLADSDSSVDVRAVFSWSYRALTPAAARLFRLLGLHPGPEFTAASAAGVAGVGRRAANALLAELTGAHLTGERVPGRYVMHDLLRAYAGELSEADPERDAARRRMLDHYLHSAVAGDRALMPHRQPVAVAAPEEGVTPEDIAEVDPLAWFTVEHQTLIAMVGCAAQAGLDRHAWQLAWATATYLGRGSYWHDVLTTQSLALSAATRLDDRPAQAQCRRELSHALAGLGRPEQARFQLHRALTDLADIADPNGQAYIHLSLGWLCELQGDRRAATHHDQVALDLFTRGGDRGGQARALNAVGWDLAQVGDYRQAIGYCRQALSLHAELGDDAGAVNTWDTLGYAYQHLGEYIIAVECYEQALGLNVGHRFKEAEALAHLGDCHHALGDLTAAAASWGRAYAIMSELRTDGAEAVRAKLELCGARTRLAAAGQVEGERRALSTAPSTRAPEK
ncbi:BTAD domain-containing putative transcriptional regulator [Dactylosporangium sp. NPDC050588]|uniref:AfsR/SARP family transcriptional regulator n=1 Tax=Dactylosporangium sp. NPDC050588 TaxID=3157211 RepID=UPI0034046783